MIAYLILGLVLLYCLYVILQWFAQAAPKEIFRAAKWVGLSFFILLLVYLALSGRLGLALAALPAILVWFGRLRMFLNVTKIIRGFFGGSQTQSSEQIPGFENVMSREEALAILGLEEGALRPEIKAAYHRLISQAHPDKGGSDYLAAKINQAKDRLLNG